MASLKEIAQMTGVSAATVSRILNNPDYGASDELKERVWQCAHKLQYVPNLHAQRLKKGESEEECCAVIDLLLTRYLEFTEDPFFNELFRNIEEELFRQCCLLHKIYSLQECTDLFQKQGLEEKKHGIIILGKSSPEVVEQLKKKYQYIIAVDRNPMNYQIDEIVCDGKLAAAEAVQYLISLGHKRIAYVGDTDRESRYEGYMETLQKNGIKPDLENVYPTKHTQREAYQAMQKIYDRQNRPTAIFCANDLTAIGIMNYLRMKKYNRYHPSIISIDNIAEAQNTKPMLTTINIPRQDMAKMAVNMLLDRMQGNHVESIHVEFRSRLVIRESCEPCME